jgi:hypothetical protein
MRPSQRVFIQRIFSRPVTRFLGGCTLLQVRPMNGLHGRTGPATPRRVLGGLDLSTEQELNTAVQFALAEYELLKDSRLSAHNGRNQRFTAYLLIVTGISALLALVYQDGTPSDLGIVMTGVSAVTLFFLGIAIFRRLVQFTITTTIYTLALNSIRAFFVEVAPALQPYLVLPTHDEPISFYGVGEETRPSVLLFNLNGTIAIINSVVLAVTMGLSLQLMLHQQLSSVALGVLALIGSIFCHFLYQRNKLDAASRRYAASRIKRHGMTT